MAEKLYGSKFYKSWEDMKKRCLNKNRPDYHRYGGRGIKVYEEWLSFEGFKKDMLSSYKEGLTLDRIDNYGDYCKDNCRWATRLEQARNTRNIERAARYTFNGISRTVREWAEQFGIKRTTLDMRLRHYNWPIEDALFDKGGTL